MKFTNQQVKTREELLKLADRYEIKRFSDGYIEKIDCFRDQGATLKQINSKENLIHTSKANYSKDPEGIDRLTSVTGFLFDEINQDYQEDIKKSSFKMLDAGKIIQSHVIGAASIDITAYTVPQTKKFYLMHYELDVQNNDIANPSQGGIYFVDPITGTARYFAWIQMPKTSPWGHTEGNFNALILPQGWQIHYDASSASSLMAANFIGVEI